METPVPQLLPAHDFSKQVIARAFPKGPPPGHTMGWQKTSGIRILPSELSVWTGINGHGKSLFLSEVVLHSAAQKVSTAIASLEMRAESTLYRMVRQACGTYRLTEREVAGCLKWLGQHVYIYDLLGTADPESMLRTFRSAIETDGITQFVVDSLMKLGLAEDDYNGQKRLTENLSNFAMKHDVHVHLVAHARKGKDENDMPGKFDVLGASGITNIAHNVYSVWRNKKKEAEVERYRGTGALPPSELLMKPDVVLACDKHREYGGDVERNYGFFFHREATRYIEKPDAEVEILYRDAEVPFVNR